MTPDTSGPTWRVPLAYYDPDLSCWRTSQGMFPLDWPTFSETCPRWGMTRRGELFALPTPELPTDEPASSSSLLPTPVTTDAHKGLPSDLRRNSPQLRALELLPTPVADHSRGLPQPGTAFQSLPNVAISLLPTPAVNDMGAGKTVEAWDAWTARMQAKHGNGNGHGPSLSIEALRLLPLRASDGEKGGPNQRGSSGDLMLPSAVVQLLPTPTAMDSHGSRGFRSDGTPYTATAGVTLTDAALSSTGAHTAPQSPAGRPSSDDQHPHQLSLDGPDPDSARDSSSG